jgi:hypothetical protein
LVRLIGIGDQVAVRLRRIVTPNIRDDAREHIIMKVQVKQIAEILEKDLAAQLVAVQFQVIHCRERVERFNAPCQYVAT